MKFWLPDSLYRLKPLLLGLAGAVLLYVSENMFTTVLAVICLGYALWIILIRLLWSSAKTMYVYGDSSRAGQHKKNVIKYPKNKDPLY